MKTENTHGGTMTDRKIRVLVAKPGLDGHDRGKVSHGRCAMQAWK
jgi:methylmalonyl-CoA mutase cobalamin-binding subunit